MNLGGFVFYVDFRDADYGTLTGYSNFQDMGLHFDVETNELHDSYGRTISEDGTYHVWDMQPRTSPVKVPVAVATSFVGADVLVDGNVHASPYQTTWLVDSAHTIGVSSPQGGYTFSSWSDGGAQTHQVVASLDNFAKVYTATFTPPLAITISGPTSLPPNELGTFTASPSGGYPLYHYDWWYYLCCENSRPQQKSPQTSPCDFWQETQYDHQTYEQCGEYDFWVKCVVSDSHSTQVTSNVIYVSVGGAFAKAALGGTSSQATTSRECPADYGLRAHPNPFNPATTVVMDLPVPGQVSLSISDVLGRTVSELARGYHEAGSHRIIWNAESAPSGVYYARLRVSDGAGNTKYTKVNRLLLLK